MRLLFGIIGLCAVIIIGLCIWDSKDMRENNCVLTSQTREEWTLITVADGNGGVMVIPEQVTEHLYTCDDHNRWR